MRLRTLAFILALSTLVGGAFSQGEPSRAETGLVGVRLFDTGLRLVNLFGTPDQILAVGVGGGGQAAPGGPPAGFGAPGAPPGGFGGRPAGGPPVGGPQGGVPGSPMGSTPIGADMGFGFGDSILQQMRQSFPGADMDDIGGPMGGPGRPGMPGRPGIGGMGAPGLPGLGGGVGGGATETVQFTRWVYNRPGSRYGFILNNQNQVVQIEAIGIRDARVNTRENVRFGTSFATVMTRYGNPDGYEVGGDTVVVRYLRDRRVAFRFNKLRRDGKFEVTGIVVTAGKP